MASQTIQVTGGYLEGDLYYPTSTLDWDTLTIRTWDDWQDWGATELFINDNPLGSYNDIVIQIDDDLDDSRFRRPGCNFSTNGSATVSLKVSETGSFTGEETTINFVFETPVGFPKGRYYRWTITITSDSDTTIPTISVPNTVYDKTQRIEYFSDLELSTLSIDSEGDYIVDTTSIGTVTHVQGTALQGTDYVVTDYIVTPTEQATYLRADSVSVTNTNTVISTSTKKFGTGAFEFDGTAKLEMDDTSLYDNTNDHTLEFWLNVESLLSSSDSVFVFEQSGGSYAWLGFLNQDGAGYRFVNNISGTPTGTRADQTSVLNLGQWYHIAVVVDDNQATIYVDGTEDSANTNDTVPSGGRDLFGGVLRIGAGTGGTADFDGYIDDFHVTESKKYTGNFTAPGEAMTVDQNTKLLLNADDFTDNPGINYGTDKYIEDQIGGAVVIESKNPLTVKVVDYNGNTWDGTVDLMVRGFEQIQLFVDGVK